MSIRRLILKKMVNLTEILILTSRYDRALENRITFQNFLLTPTHEIEFKHRKSYEKLGLIGKGSQGNIYIIKQNDKKYIMKESLPANDLFMKEVKIHQYINYHCPNVGPKFYDYISKINDNKFFMEHLNGIDLDLFVKSSCNIYGNTCIPVNTVKDIAKQSIEKLRCLHENGIVHGDIKAHNIMLILVPPEKIQIYLIDFGFSCLYNKKSTCGCGNKIHGTPNYFSPKVARGITNKNKKISLDRRKNDVWALGIVIYYLMFRHLPFKSSDKHDLFLQISNKEPEIHDYPDKGLIDLVGLFLTKDENERPYLEDIDLDSFFD